MSRAKSASSPSFPGPSRPIRSTAPAPPAAQAIVNAADQIVLGHADVVAGRRGGVAVRYPDPALPAVQRDPGRGQQGEEPVPAAWRPSPGCGRGTSCRSPRRSPSPPPASRWASRPRRWPRRTASAREAQDRLALMSHQRAAAATADGRLTAEIAPWFGGRGMDEVAHHRQRHPRRHLARGAGQAPAGVRPPLRPVTAGNASPLTDGGGGGAHDGRGEGARARLSPPRHGAQLRRGGGRSGLAAADGAGLSRCPGPWSAPD